MLHLVLVLWMADASVLRKPDLICSRFRSSWRAFNVQRPVNIVPCTRILAKRYGKTLVLRVAQAITSFIAWRFLARAQPPIHMRVWQARLTMRLYVSMSAFSARTVVRGMFPSTRDHLVHIMHHASYSVKSPSLFPVLRTPAMLQVRTGRSSDKMMAVAQ
jgi:hypothetical protein